MGRIDSRGAFLGLFRSFGKSEKRAEMLRLVGAQKFAAFFASHTMDFDVFYGILTCLVARVKAEGCRDFAEMLRFILENKRNRLNVKMIHRDERRKLKSDLQRRDPELFAQLSKALD